MSSFADVASEEPEFAARVRTAFDAHAHKFLATLRADGSPRISGIEMQFVAGEPWLAGMPGSVKFTDLRGDPRFALHSGSNEPDAFDADAKLGGRATQVTDPDERGRYAAAAGVPAERYMREAKVMQIFEGTNQIQRMVIGKDLAREAAG